jgi:hypothetical protein
MDEDLVFLENLPTSVRGFCFLGEDGEPVIVLNSRLTREQNRKTYEHEKKHIANDDLRNPDYHEYGA